MARRTPLSRGELIDRLLRIAAVVIPLYFALRSLPAAVRVIVGGGA